MFTTIGCLKIRIIEVQYVNSEEPLKPRGIFGRKQESSLSPTVDLFLLLQVMSKESTQLFYQQSQTFPCAKKGGNCLVGEEYTVNQLESSGSISISMYCMKDVSSVSQKKTQQPTFQPFLIGSVYIPLKRLEADIMISQWYQMIHPITNEGLKSAMRIELLYTEEFKQNTAIVQHVVANEDNIRDTNIAGGVDSSYDGSIDHKDQESNHNDGNEDHGDDDNESYYEGLAGEKRLPVGIVDYCLIIGQETRSINCPVCNNCIHNSATENQPIASDLSPLSSSPLTPNRPVINDCCIWDRFPPQDYPDHPLPNKIEWFACPDGAKIIYAPTRPPYKVSTYLLSTEGGSADQYGVKLRFFMNVGPCRHCKDFTGQINEKGNNPTEAKSSAWWLSEDFDKSNSQIDPPLILFEWEKNQEAAFLSPLCEYSGRSESNINCDDNNNDCLWLSVDITLLSRWQFIAQLSQCLAFIYQRQILPRLEEYEASSSLVKYESPTLPHAPFDLNCEDIIVALCLECPVPVLGLCSIKFKLPSDIKSKQSLNAIERVQNNHSILFKLPSQDQFPRCPYALDTIVRLLGPRLFVDVVCCILTESRILLHSNDMALLPVICECLLSAIYPLYWAHVYLPAIPAMLLDLVEAPVPFILGMHTSWLTNLPLHRLDDVIVVDCDMGSIDYGINILSSGGGGRGGDDCSGLVSFPRDIDCWLILCLKDILKCSDGSVDADSIATNSLHIQILFFDVMSSMLRFSPHCLFYLDKSTPIFNRVLFLNEYCPPLCRNFMERLSDTNAFHKFTDSIQKPNLAFFKLAAASVSYPETFNYNDPEFQLLILEYRNEDNQKEEEQRVEDLPDDCYSMSDVNKDRSASIGCPPPILKGSPLPSPIPSPMSPLSVQSSPAKLGGFSVEHKRQKSFRLTSGLSSPLPLLFNNETLDGISSPTISEVMSFTPKFIKQDSWSGKGFKSFLQADQSTPTHASVSQNGVTVIGMNTPKSMASPAGRSGIHRRIGNWPNRELLQSVDEADLEASVNEAAERFNSDTQDQPHHLVPVISNSLSDCCPPPSSNIPICEPSIGQSVVTCDQLIRKLYRARLAHYSLLFASKGDHLHNDNNTISSLSLLTTEQNGLDDPVLSLNPFDRISLRDRPKDRGKYRKVSSPTQSSEDDFGVSFGVVSSPSHSEEAADGYFPALNMSSPATPLVATAAECFQECGSPSFNSYSDIDNKFSSQLPQTPPEARWESQNLQDMILGKEFGISYDASSRKGLGHLVRRRTTISPKDRPQRASTFMLPSANGAAGLFGAVVGLASGVVGNIATSPRRSSLSISPVIASLSPFRSDPTVPGSGAQRSRDASEDLLSSSRDEIITLEREMDDDEYSGHNNQQISYHNSNSGNSSHHYVNSLMDHRSKSLSLSQSGHSDASGLMVFSNSDHSRRSLGGRHRTQTIVVGMRLGTSSSMSGSSIDSGGTEAHENGMFLSSEVQYQSDSTPLREQAKSLLNSNSFDETDDDGDNASSNKPPGDGKIRPSIAISISIPSKVGSVEVSKIGSSLGEERTQSTSQWPWGNDFFPVKFDTDRLVEASHQMVTWTVAKLAESLYKELVGSGDFEADVIAEISASLLRNYLRIMEGEDGASTDFVENDTGSTREQAHVKNTRLLTRSAKKLSHWLDSSTSHDRCEASVLNYLQVVISGQAMDESLSMLKKSCIEALYAQENRSGLIEILEQSHYNYDTLHASQVGNNQSTCSFKDMDSDNTGEGQQSPVSRSRSTSMQYQKPIFYPLNIEAFEALSELFLEMLNICVIQKDFIVAYELLVAGGFYFSISNASSREMNNCSFGESGDVEFLSSRIFHHPLYQNNLLWRAVLQQRVPTPSHDDTSLDASIGKIIMETHAVLYLMQDLGVNPERSLLFLQGVVEDYKLDMQTYVDLRRFLQLILANPSGDVDLSNSI